MQSEHAVEPARGFGGFGGLVTFLGKATLLVLFWVWVLFVLLLCGHLGVSFLLFWVGLRWIESLRGMYGGCTSQCDI